MWPLLHCMQREHLLDLLKGVTFLQTQLPYYCVCQKRYFSSVSSFIFLFSTGTLPRLRQLPSLPENIARSWQSYQLSTDSHLPSPHPSPQPPLTTHLPSIADFNSPLQGWQDLPPARLETPTQLPPPEHPDGSSAQESCRRGNRCSLILETVARWRFPPRNWVIKKLRRRGSGLPTRSAKFTCVLSGNLYTRAALRAPEGFCQALWDAAPGKWTKVVTPRPPPTHRLRANGQSLAPSPRPVLTFLIWAAMSFSMLYFSKA